MAEILRKSRGGGGCNPLVACISGALCKILDLQKDDKSLSECRIENGEWRIFKGNNSRYNYQFSIINSQLRKRAAFTLAEVLITLGVIGVVAAITMPVLMTNVQARVQKEQVRSAKYKLTLATDKMKSMGLLENQYPTTMDFVNELKKHFKIAMICDNNHLTDCWPSDKIEIPTTSGITTKDVSTIRTGADLISLGLGTVSIQTVGIITADGVPMIMTYSPKCAPLDSARTYSWSTIDNKPETNATTNCISAVMDINGTGKPNRLGKDVRTWNSLLGYQRPGRQTLSYSECQKWKNKLGINECYKDETGERDDDYWGGSVKACYDLGLHLPSTQTLANIAGARYGRSDITPYTLITSLNWIRTRSSMASYKNYSCDELLNNVYQGSKYQFICIDNGSVNSMNNIDTTSAVSSFDGYFWAASEVSSQEAFKRDIRGTHSAMGIYPRSTGDPLEPICLGD